MDTALWTAFTYKVLIWAECDAKECCAAVVVYSMMCIRWCAFDDVHPSGVVSKCTMELDLSRSELKQSSAMCVWMESRNSSQLHCAIFWVQVKWNESIKNVQDISALESITISGWKQFTVTSDRWCKLISTVRLWLIFFFGHLRIIVRNAWFFAH